MGIGTFPVPVPVPVKIGTVFLVKKQEEENGLGDRERRINSQKFRIESRNSKCSHDDRQR